MENYERQTFTGPPENVRDHVIAACRAMAAGGAVLRVRVPPAVVHACGPARALPAPPLAGDWRRCYAVASSLSCWALLPQRETVLAMLRGKVQEEGLRTYLLSYAPHYSSLSMAQLCDMFELPERKVCTLGGARGGGDVGQVGRGLAGTWAWDVCT